MRRWGAPALRDRRKPARRHRRAPTRQRRRTRSRGGCGGRSRRTGSQRSDRAATPVRLNVSSVVSPHAATAEHRADAADDGRPLGAQPHRHALHPHARVRAARVRDHPLRRGDPDLPRDRNRRRADAADSPLRPAARRPCGALPLAEPALVRLRTREDERLDDRPDPGRDPDLRGVDRACVRARAAVTAVLARGHRLLRGRRPRGARRVRRPLGRPSRRPARDRDGRDLGGLLGGDRAADGALLRLADQRRRALARLGPDRDRGRAADARAGLRARLDGLVAARVRDARAARDHERALVSLAAPDRRPPAPPWSRTCSRSSPRSSRSCSSTSR